METKKTVSAQQSVSIDEDIILSVAKQAKLHLTPTEVKMFRDDLKEILKTFAVLDEIDVSKTKPSFRPIEERNHLREDIAKPSISQEDALQFTDDARDGYFIGPRTVENK